MWRRAEQGAHDLAVEGTREFLPGYESRHDHTRGSGGGFVRTPSETRAAPDAVAEPENPEPGAGQADPGPPVDAADQGDQQERYEEQHGADGHARHAVDVERLRRRWSSHEMNGTEPRVLSSGCYLRLPRYAL